MTSAAGSLGPVATVYLAGVIIAALGGVISTYYLVRGAVEKRATALQEKLDKKYDSGVEDGKHSRDVEVNGLQIELRQTQDELGQTRRDRDYYRARAEPGWKAGP